MNDLEKKKEFNDYYVERMQFCKDYWLCQWIDRRWTCKDRKEDELLKFYDKMVEFYDNLIINF